MNVLMVSLVKRPVTPQITASRSRVIYDIASGLIKKGHTVTILGTGDSNVPGATIIPVVPHALEFAGPFENEMYAHSAMLTLLANKLREIGNNYDIIHNHTYPECFNLLVAHDLKTPMITTIHAQPFPVFDQAMSVFHDRSYFIAISEAHRSLFKDTHLFRVVHNGIDTEQYAFQKEKDDYLLWLGRLSKAKNDDGTYQDPKGIRHAIRLAHETGQRLTLSGNVEDMDFFNHDVKPHLNDRITWVGPVSPEHALKKEQVIELMQKAKCFLMTVNWDEPFGLVMAESMSCGTPVIGFDRGSVAEIVNDGKTGFVVPHGDSDGLKNALGKIDTIKPEDCRQHVVDHFSIDRMVTNYEKVYTDIITNHS